MGVVTQSELNVSTQIPFTKRIFLRTQVLRLILPLFISLATTVVPPQRSQAFGQALTIQSTMRLN